MNKRPFHEDDALGTALVGGEGQQSKSGQKNKVAGYQWTG